MRASPGVSRAAPPWRHARLAERRAAHPVRDAAVAQWRAECLYFDRRTVRVNVQPLGLACRALRPAHRTDRLGAPKP
ncbi:hypothetical protein [Aquabacterium sp.]|uniref:hypothetical protein n=1 Tax=Aquabacterium sp. TaxID=1872578 RepID=UPI00248913C3|nr:hypothetical protein [Aquabacterium sp.]MDI1348444.1 hypothetical protein [Aquabacterium sp.]